MICFKFAQRYPWASPDVVMNMTYPQLAVLAPKEYEKRASTPFVVKTASPEFALALVRAAQARKKSNVQ